MNRTDFQRSEMVEKKRKDGEDRTRDGERWRKVRGTFPPQRGQKTKPIMERSFQKQRLEDAPSFHQFQYSLKGEREGNGGGRRA